MNDLAHGTMLRSDKGPISEPPVLNGSMAVVADAVAGWPGVTASVHWDLYSPTTVDGIDFYVGELELGHIHLDGSIHLATSTALSRALIAEGAARPFRYQRGWVEEKIQRIGTDAAIALFQRNYNRLAIAN